ncbi:hypothetical protein BGZ95_002596 [Linnemannia exigua]|uniref:Uncharacterized protein n=1 Tax=Linnemannia exigua TaxID=604196 RepID=A0AAD4D598_9FUNG|nr:hypothetical protein BGZ95_002596 [Linnemannia exigua]
MDRQGVGPTAIATATTTPSTSTQGGKLDPSRPILEEGARKDLLKADKDWVLAQAKCPRVINCMMFKPTPTLRTCNRPGHRF